MPSWLDGRSKQPLTTHVLVHCTATDDWWLMGHRAGATYAFVMHSGKVHEEGVLYSPFGRDIVNEYAIDEERKDLILFVARHFTNKGAWRNFAERQAHEFGRVLERLAC